MLFSLWFSYFCVRLCLLVFCFVFFVHETLCKKKIECIYWKKKHTFKNHCHRHNCKCVPGYSLNCWLMQWSWNLDFIWNFHNILSKDAPACIEYPLFLVFILILMPTLCWKSCEKVLKATVCLTDCLTYCLSDNEKG